ncbi:MAG: hypothetical protein JXA79_03980 [Deltaproteobacteria bacterium]|nr:hypothetical protein [Deltaproteobacteria bacterium]
MEQLYLQNRDFRVIKAGDYVKYAGNTTSGFVFALLGEANIIGNANESIYPGKWGYINPLNVVSYANIPDLPSYQPLDADLTRLANYRRIGGDVNFTEFEADGTMEMNGNATVWEDLNFDPDTSGGPAVSLPDYVTINNVIHREFTSANNQLCGDGEEMPHKYKLSSTIYPHIHVFLKSGEGAGTTGAAFTFYWELRQTTGTTSGSVVLTATSADLAANPHKVDVYDNTGFAGAAELGSQLTVTLARTAGDAGDVIVTTYGVHYEIDTVGSRTLTSK